jgi:hypothetical protein
VSARGSVGRPARRRRRRRRRRRHQLAPISSFRLSLSAAAADGRRAPVGRHRGARAHLLLRELGHGCCFWFWWWRLGGTFGWDVWNRLLFFLLLLLVRLAVDAQGVYGQDVALLLLLLLLFLFVREREGRERERGKKTERFTVQNFESLLSLSPLSCFFHSQVAEQTHITSRADSLHYLTIDTSSSSTQTQHKRERTQRKSCPKRNVSARRAPKQQTNPRAPQPLCARRLPGPY